jgi:hypothetical protein
MYKWIVAYGGGLGPDTWDAEMIVDADNIRSALDQAEKLLANIDESFAIFYIEQQF